MPTHPNKLTKFWRELKRRRVDRPDKAMEWLEKGFEANDPNMPYIATHGYLLDPLFDNTRFIDILEKMNLPLPKS